MPADDPKLRYGAEYDADSDFRGARSAAAGYTIRLHVGSRGTTRITPAIARTLIAELTAVVAECDADVWRPTLKPGDLVEVRRDDGRLEAREVTREPWAVSGGRMILGLEGISGGFSLRRITRLLRRKADAGITEPPALTDQQKLNEAVLVSGRSLAAAQERRDQEYLDSQGNGPSGGGGTLYRDREPWYGTYPGE